MVDLSSIETADLLQDDLHAPISFVDGDEGDELNEDDESNEGDEADEADEGDGD